MAAGSADDVAGSVPSALSLAATAGFVDAVGYLTLDHLFVAHMSGNSARLGVDLGAGDLGSAAPIAFAIALFVAGIGLGTAVGELAHRGGLRNVGPLLLGLEMLLLGALIAAWTWGGVAGRPRGSGGFYGLAALAVLAMGVQTAALRRVGGRSVHTTYVSGVLTGMITNVVHYAFTRYAGEGDERRALREGGLLAAVWSCYAVGAVCGGATGRVWQAWSLLLPVAVLAAVVLGQLRPGVGRQPQRQR